MTAVAPPPNFHAAPRPWSSGGQNNLTTSSMTATTATSGSTGANSLTATATEEVARMWMPRSKSGQRSSASTADWASSIGRKKGSSRCGNGISNGIVGGGGSMVGPGAVLGGGLGAAALVGGAVSGWSAKSDLLRLPGGPLPSHPGPNGTAIANGGMGSLNSSILQPTPILPSQHLMSAQSQQQQQQQQQHQQQQQQQAGGNNSSQQQGTSYLLLLPLNGTFERKFIPLPYYPETLRIGRQTNAKTIPTQSNGYFDSKVLSRQHAEVWADKAGRVWIRDIKSSNGTFVNGQRLSQENRDSEPHELRAEDVLELGIDIVGEDNKTIMHHKVAARVEHAGLQGGNVPNEISYTDIETLGSTLMSPQVSHAAAPNSVRGRSGSQSSRTSIAPGASALNHKQMPMMLAPISFEMVVKKLNYELQAAKEQSHDLHKTSAFFDTMLASTKQRPPSTTEPLPQPPSQLPALPLLITSEPLPPPDLTALPSPVTPPPNSVPALLINPPNDSQSLKPRADPPQQLLSLIDALASTRRELELKTARVRDLEDALKKERDARESAEDRVARLETASLALIPSLSDDGEEISGATELDDTASVATLKIDEIVENGTGTSSSPEPEPKPEQPEVKVDPAAVAAAEAADRLQKRVEEMMTELQSAREEIEVCKRRAEAAEAMDATSRKTLAEMVEKFRREGEARKAQKELAVQTDVVEVASSGTQVDYEKDEVVDKFVDIVRREEAVNDRGEELKAQKMRMRKDQLVLSKREVAPYASILGVMLFGVGLMTVLNGWQKDR